MRARSTSPLLVIITVMLGVLMGVLDAAIVNVAIPTIGGNLGATPDVAAWVATGYTLGMMIVMPLNGWLTARLGQKNYYIAALAVFTLASFLCGASTNIWELIVLRVIQGLGGGAMQPIALAILLKTAAPERRADMIAAFSFASTAPFAAGPVIGGYILDTYESWPLLFYFKLPILIAGLVMALMWLPKDEPSGDTPPMQWTGLALLATGLATLQVVLSRGQQEDWFDSDRIVTFTVVALVAWLAFVVLQLRARRPFVNLRIFGTLSFSIGCIVTVVSGFGLYGINLVTPLFFQGPLGLTPYQSGIFLLQGSIATFVVIPFVGPLTRRIDARVVVGGGLLLFGIGAWMMGSLNAETGYWDLFVPRVLQGIGLGLMFAPLLAMTLAGIAPSEMSDATGIATLVRYLGGNIGIALLEVLQVRREDAVSASIAGSVTLQHPGAAELVRTMGLPHARMVLAAAEQANATLISYLYLFRLTAILFLATIALLAFLPNLRAARKAAPPKDVDVELAEELDEALEPQPQMALRSAQPAT